MVVVSISKKTKFFLTLLFIVGLFLGIYYITIYFLKDREVDPTVPSIISIVILCVVTISALVYATLLKNKITDHCVKKPNDDLCKKVVKK